jgi:hypothetical protein
MSEMDFDFGAEFAAFGDDLKGTAYDGDYTMRVSKAKPSRTQKGKMQIQLTLAFQGGPLGAKGKTVDDRLVWSPESEVAAKIFAQTLRTLGAPQEWIMQAKPSPQQICDQITGAVVECKLSPDEWNGQPRTKISYRKALSTNAIPGGAIATTPGISSAAASAVSLDDETADTPAAAPVKAKAEVKEPVTVGASTPATAAPESPANADDPWA